MRAPTRRLPPSPAGTAGRTRIMQIELEQFADQLYAARIAKGWSQSELARQVWGELTTKAGRKVARNRDRISTYEKGKSWPDPTI
jgi:ribosome-binding protein aMBF1 (putative translation factor)